MQNIFAVSFLIVALICGFTSVSRLEAVSQPSQGGGYPDYEPTTGATPDCLVTPKNYQFIGYDNTHPPPPTPMYRIYSELQCCKISYSGPNLSTQTTTCANYYEWKSQSTMEDRRLYGFPEYGIDTYGYLPPYHAYLKSINNGGETISPPPINTTGPGECVYGCGCFGCLAPGGNASNPGNNTLPTLPITKVHNPTSPGLFSSVGNATNPGNNTGTLPPGSIFKVPPGSTSALAPSGNNTAPGNSMIPTNSTNSNSSPGNTNSTG